MDEVELNITDARVFRKVYKPENNRSEQWSRYYDLIGLRVNVPADMIKPGDFITNCPRMKKALELCGAITQQTKIDETEKIYLC